jgi:Tfp pilus assembly protein PilF
VELLNKAVARDPNFFLAYCQLAFVHDLVYQQEKDHTPARLALAQLAIDSAFRLRPDSGEAHLALGWHLYWGYADYARARAELALAQQSLPNNPRVYELAGLIDRRQGRWSEATQNLERACELDPRNIPNLITLATTYLWLHDFTFNTSNVFTGWVIISGETTVDATGNANSGPATVQVYDPNGNLLVSLCADAVGTRFEL